VSVDEPEVAVDGRGCPTGKGPCSVVVVGHRCVGVLEEGDCDCNRSVLMQEIRCREMRLTHQSSC
jgi:hypothetical protein